MVRRPLKVWPLSDLHVELDRNWELPSPPPEFDVAIIAGNVITSMDRGVKWLSERLGGKPAIYVPGDREPFGADIDRTIAEARAAATGTNIRILQNEVCVVGGVRFAGCTLWSNFDLFGQPDAAMAAAGEQVADYKEIRKDTRRLRPYDTLLRHRDSCSYLASTLTDGFRGDSVVVTHFPPLRLPPCERHSGIIDGDKADILDACDQSDLALLIAFTGPKLWLFGHVQRSVDVTMGETRLVANPRGHPGELNRNFDPHLTIEI